MCVLNLHLDGVDGDVGHQQIGVLFELDAFGIQETGTRRSEFLNMVEEGGRV